MDKLIQDIDRLNLTDAEYLQIGLLMKIFEALNKMEMNSRN